MNRTRYVSARLLLLVFLCAALVLPGCDLLGEDDPDGRLVTEGVVVGNGGNFGDQNGSLTIYDPATDTTTSSEPLNAFLLGMALRNDRLYAVLNNLQNAGRINVHDAESSYTLINQVFFPRPPRAIGFVSDEKAYVPAQTLDPGFTPVSSIAYVVDLEQGAAVDSIDVGRQPEDVVVTEDKAFVANYGATGDGRTLTVIDTDTDAASGTIELGCDGPNELFVDDEGELVVVCQGKTVFNDSFEVIEQTNGQVLFVDPEAETVRERLRYDVQLGNGTQGASYSGATEELYVVSDGNGQVVRVNTDENTKGSTIPVPPNSSLAGLTAVAYDAAAERLYLARRDAAQPFQSAGTVLILARQDAGTFQKADAFVAGPAPSHIVLNRRLEE